MDTNQTIAISQAPVPAASPEATEVPKTPRNGKIAKIKRKENSFRPGCNVMAATTKPNSWVKKLVFSIPSASPLSSPDEAAEVQRIVAGLTTHDQRGSITSFSFHDAAWEIVFTLTVGTTADEDEFLSGVFRDLMPTIENLPYLCNGFRNGAMSSWEYRVGANLLDSGNLN